MEMSRPISNDAISPWADWAGVGTSALCVIHCIVTPFLLSFSVVLAHFLPSEESTHRWLAIGIAAIGAIALVRGFRIHRRARVLLMMGTGLAFIFAGAWWGHLLTHHWMEVAITFTGSAFMISAHRFNHTFCRECICARQVCNGAGAGRDASQDALEPSSSKPLGI